ncbi:hypothetical protein LOAG_05686 [Loa loa]|uniref:Uncharacterized protein n=1 Tax=Loa loa TaxID=7209 RepID=A0A1S0U000_LOALO|nr:hypothetical protein LOAG_05686 [Loa loa]EFO22803.1 hypothetical protein LOAG_05686 [Loa loa]
MVTMELNSLNAVKQKTNSTDLYVTHLEDRYHAESKSLNESIIGRIGVAYQSDGQTCRDDNMQRKKENMKKIAKCELFIALNFIFRKVIGHLWNDQLRNQ